MLLAQHTRGTSREAAVKCRVPRRPWEPQRSRGACGFKSRPPDSWTSGSVGQRLVPLSTGSIERVNQDPVPKENEGGGSRISVLDALVSVAEVDTATPGNTSSVSRNNFSRGEARESDR